MEWQDISTAPTDRHHVRGIWVRHRPSGNTYWEVVAGYVDDETGEFIDHDGNSPWRAEDYTHWMPLPPAPEATE